MEQRNAFLFKETLENPCVLSMITQSLRVKDLVNLKLLSKDHRFNEVLSDKLNSIKKRKDDVLYITRKTIVLMDEVKKSKGSTQRQVKIRFLFDFLLEHKWFVHDHPRFSTVIEKKLFEFIEDCQEFTSDAVKYLSLFFNLKPPAYYYNSQLRKTQYGMFDTNKNFKEIKR